MAFPVKIYECYNASMAFNAVMHQIVWRFPHDGPYPISTNHVPGCPCCYNLLLRWCGGWRGRSLRSSSLSWEICQSRYRIIWNKHKLNSFVNPMASNNNNAFQPIPIDRWPLNKERARLQRCVAAVPGVAAPGSEARVWQTPRFARKEKWIWFKSLCRQEPPPSIDLAFGSATAVFDSLQHGVGGPSFEAPDTVILLLHCQRLNTSK